MKPSWKDAPEWATFLAMDKDGRWFWYQHIPIFDDSGCWFRSAPGAMMRAEIVLDDCMAALKSLEMRP